MPTRRFDHIHVDLVGPLPPSNGSRYLFTVIDRFTRWPAAYPLQDMETSSCARALRQWISDFGVPSDISSDRGTQFTGQLWKDLTQLLGIQLHHTTSYHPQANGIVERFHRSLKASIMARMTTETWSDELPWVMLGLRTAPKPDLGVSPAELVYGAPLALPAEFLSGQPDPDTPAALLHRIRERIAQIAPIPTSWHSKPVPHEPTALMEAQFVFVRRDGRRSPLQRPYDGPYRVLQRNNKTFKIAMGNREEVISIDRLKAAVLDPAEQIVVAIPPTRGRPRLVLQPVRFQQDVQVQEFSESSPPASPPLSTSKATLRSTSGRTMQVPARYKD